MTYSRESSEHTGTNMIRLFECLSILDFGSAAAQYAGTTNSELILVEVNSAKHVLALALASRKEKTAS